MPAPRPGHVLAAVLVMSALSVIGTVAILQVAPSAQAGAYIAALFAALAPSTVALLALLQARETHLAVNSRMDELLKVTRSSSEAKGKLAGAAEQKATMDTPPGETPAP